MELTSISVIPQKLWYYTTPIVHTQKTPIAHVTSKRVYICFLNVLITSYKQNSEDGTDSEKCDVPLQVNHTRQSEYKPIYKVNIDTFNAKELIPQFTIKDNKYESYFINY